MKKLYFGDNLTIMREMEDGFVDLIATDPPFNSGRDYNAFFTESKAQSKAFTDIWQWDTGAQDARTDIAQRAKANDTYKALDNCLKGYDLVLQNAVSGNKGAMRAYLAFMGPRLAEMHRLLRDTGSIYLHCDPTASHYLKGIMDAIWDQSNRKKNEYFRNEIVWCYRGAGYPKKDFGRRHDIILRYSKGAEHVFNLDDVREEYAEATKERFKHYIGNKRKSGDFGVQQLNPLGKHPDDWWQIQPVAPSSKERLGYPTQKPLALYERMIKASSNEGALVMDPFCGCGTTIDAAHTLNRRWIGIDLTVISLDPIGYRLFDRHGLLPHTDYEIDGYPTNMQEVYKLVRDEKKYHDFSNWAVTRVGLKPTANVGDGGKDGVGHFMLWEPDTDTETQRRIIAEVKTGKPTTTQVRAFRDVINSQNAVAGIFITLEPVTAGMRQLAADMGTFEHAESGNSYPRLQFWQIDDAYFQNPETLKEILRLPREWIRPRKKSERHAPEIQLPLLESLEPNTSIKT